MEESKDIFCFNTGLFECTVISDGKIVAPNSQEKIDVKSLFIRTGEHSALIDTGSGVMGKPLGGKLLQNLEAAGIQNWEIDTVILSHGHGDHVGGNTDTDGRPLFPNARYFMHKKEWEFWTTDPELSQFDVDENVRKIFIETVQKNLLPIKDQLHLIDEDKEILPGIEVIKTPGHTPGHIAIVISSDAEKLISTGDMIHQPPWLEQPDLFNVFDFANEEGCRTRIQFLSRKIATNSMVFACHFPFPGLGNIIPNGDTWLWKPFNTNYFNEGDKNG